MNLVLIMNAPGRVGWLLRWTAAGFLVHGLWIVANWYALRPDGSSLALWYALLLTFPGAYALLLILVGLAGLIPRGSRAFSARLLSASLIWVLSFIICVRVAGVVRMQAMREFAERSQPLVAAIHAYEREQGRPPSGLQELVPKYLPSIPATGMTAYPKYQLYTGEVAARYEGNLWVLAISTPSGGINFDSMLYFPKQNYPEVGHGGWLERVEDWGYLHE